MKILQCISFALFIRKHCYVDKLNSQQVLFAFLLTEAFMDCFVNRDLILSFNSLRDSENNQLLRE